MSIDFQIATRYPVNEDKDEWVLYNFAYMVKKVKSMYEVT